MVYLTLQGYGGGKADKNVLVLLVSCTYGKRVASVHRAAEKEGVLGKWLPELPILGNPAKPRSY
jgi:hypothetical protein